MSYHVYIIMPKTQQNQIKYLQVDHSQQSRSAALLFLTLSSDTEHGDN
jgi:hypothetical protein